MPEDPVMADSGVTIDGTEIPVSKKEEFPVFFRDLWYFFQPGGYIVRKTGYQRVWRIVQCTGGRAHLSVAGNRDRVDNIPYTARHSRLTLDCYYIDFDGKRFGPVYHQFVIKAFEHSRDITSLEVFPLEYITNSGVILEELSKQGESFVNVTQACHRYCVGQTITRTPTGEKLYEVSHPEDVDGPVMIDFDRALQTNPRWCPEFALPKLGQQDGREIREMTLADEVTGGNSRGHCFDVNCCQNENILDDLEWDRLRRDEFVASERMVILFPEVGNSVTPTSTECRLFPNRVFGFILRSRKWACLPVSSLKGIKRETSNLQYLELPGQHKDIVTGLVETHFRNKEKEKRTQKHETRMEFDLVRAKGKGLIILLHGAPGVGKTSTAECIAEANATPLFPITCGDLGMDPMDVEANLDTNFQLAESWGCVLLLDEADVFLAQRTQNDITRNALVSIFLRALEYYSGVLFLTTNRVGTIDEAFRSRIHISLLYPILTEVQTIKIWEGQLARAKQRDPTLIVKTEDVLSYARNLYKQQMEKRKVGWNGRQIRNAMQTAVALAEHNSVISSTNPDMPQSPSLEIRWFDIIAAASWQFEAYLEDALQLSAREYARQFSFRADRASSDHLVMPQVSAVAASVRPLYDPKPTEPPSSIQPQNGSLIGITAGVNHQSSSAGHDTSPMPQWAPRTPNGPPTTLAVSTAHYTPTPTPHHPTLQGSSSLFGATTDVQLPTSQQMATSNPFGAVNIPNLPQQASLMFNSQQPPVTPNQQYLYYGSVDPSPGPTVAHSWRDSIPSTNQIGNMAWSGHLAAQPGSQYPQPSVPGPGNSAR
ncbi:hypothetical protein CCUS01_06442 [Colletotrichum cuscutae]|uniref:AAA+ ATPase domain-containing protein n=1 Tax=Colletotrichum cuscutae TaxID=1209917 RepID=A0AAI9V7N6_9PEZI|nr:hypothetical protein CCUS01_06442 [Colletotrichum cuscutae]